MNDEYIRKGGYATADLAKHWNVQPQNITNWLIRGKLPEPDLIVSKGKVKVYLESTIEKFEQTEEYKKLMAKHNSFGKSPTEE
ncbi:UNVERIFIED_CONTAM: hypothetical protein ODR73_25800 [Escherichia coli]